MAIAVLSVLATAYLGWVVEQFLRLPQFFDQGAVDPTTASVASPTILSAVDTPAIAIQVLHNTAQLTDRNDEDALILHLPVEFTYQII